PERTRRIGASASAACPDRRSGSRGGGRLGAARARPGAPRRRRPGSRETLADPYADPPLAAWSDHAGYLITQKPCASIPRGTFSLLRKFSSATAAVSSTTCASSKK